MLQQPSDRGGTPLRLSPHERRIPGWLFLLILLAVIALSVLTINAIFGLDVWTTSEVREH